MVRGRMLVQVAKPARAEPASAPALASRRRNRQPRWSLPEPMSVRVRRRSIRRDRLPHRCLPDRHAGGVRHGVRGGGGAARRFVPDRHAADPAASSASSSSASPSSATGLSMASATTRSASLSSRGSAAFTRLAAAAPPPPPLAAMTVAFAFAGAFFASCGSVVGQPFGLFGFDFRFGVERLFVVIGLPRPAAGRPQPAPRAAPWPLPAYAPVRRDR